MNRPDADKHYPIDLDRLPAGWVAANVGEIIFDIQPGFASGVHNQDGLGVPHLRPMNIDREGRLDFSVLKYVPPGDPLRIARGDILFNNTNSPELVGKTTSIDRDGEWAFSNHMTRLRPPDGIAGKFVAHQLHFLWTAGYFRNRCTHHVNQASIASKTLAETVPLAVPPTGEQHRIVAEIEKQFTRLDAAVAALKRIQANLRRYRASVLKAACEGRLVPIEAELARAEGGEYEPADSLLTRILKERRAKWEADQLAKMQVAGKAPRDDKWKAMYPEPVASNTSTLSDLPERWTWASLDQCFVLERGRFSIRPRNDPRYYDGLYPFVQIGDLPRGGGRIYRYSQTLNEDGLAVSKMFPKGTVLIAIVGATIGNTGILTFDSCCPDSLIAIRSNDEIRLRYAEMYLRLKKLEIRESSYASGGQPNINLNTLLPYPIPLPPVDEQNRIVSEVERRLSVIDEFESMVADGLKRAERLRQCILKHAFEAKLVAQDPNDEPANALLERIRAEREKAGVGDGTRKPRMLRRRGMAAEPSIRG